MPSHRSLVEREQLVRTVLTSPIEMSHEQVAVKAGVQRETVRKIRFGIINTDILADLPRLEKGCLQRVCSKCIHFEPVDTLVGIARRRSPERARQCGLGFPEVEDLTFARGCAAFVEQVKP